MKIAVNLHCLQPPLTGIGHYSLELIRLLTTHPLVSDMAGVSHLGWHDSDELTQIVASEEGYDPDRSQGSDDSLAAPRPVSARIPDPVKSVLRRIPGLGNLRARVNLFRQRQRASEFADFLYWEPNYLLLPIGNKAVTTVHDLSHLHYPEFHPRERLRELAKLPESLSKAAAVVAVSEFTRSELARSFDIDPASVRIVSPAVGPQFRPREDSLDKLVRDRLQLPERFCLTMGTLEPRKNLQRLIEAFSALPHELQSDCPLIVVGAVGWHADGIESALLSCDSSLVRHLGYVAPEWVPALYRMASCMAYPSLYEGFGMPILEAMASGTPVVTSNVASMPEVSGGATELVDPLSVAGLTTALERVLSDPERQQEMSRRGLEVAATHTWERSVARLLDTFEEVAAA